MPNVFERSAATAAGDPLRDVDAAPRSPLFRGGFVEKLRRWRVESRRKLEDGFREDGLASQQRVVGRSADSRLTEHARERSFPRLAAPPNRLRVEPHGKNVLFNSTRCKWPFGDAVRRSYFAAAPRNDSKKFTMTLTCSAVRIWLEV